MEGRIRQKVNSRSEKSLCGVRSVCSRDVGFSSTAGTNAMMSLLDWRNMNGKAEGFWPGTDDRTLDDDIGSVRREREKNSADQNFLALPLFQSYSFFVAFVVA